MLQAVNPVIPGIAAIAPSWSKCAAASTLIPTAFEETLTSDLVAELLAGWGYEVHRGIGKTGVVGVLREGQGTRTVGLRADMDALPLAETTGLPYASRHANKMCMRPRRPHRDAAVRGAPPRSHAPVLRHAEPDLPAGRRNFGGAKAMMDDGLFDRFPCDAIFAIHNMPGRAAGDMASAPAPRWRRPIA